MKRHSGLFWALSVLVLALAPILTPLSGPPAALAAPGGYRAASPEYGMSVFVYGNPGTTQRDFKKLTDVGFGWQKSLFRWRDLETDCRGCYAWTESDRLVKASADAGLKIIARIDWQPTWARRDKAENGAPDNYEDFANFIKAFTTRYKAGSQFGTVQSIEIWNEVNLQREWGGPINEQAAADYVRMLGMAYQAAKSVDPTITIITAGLSPTGWNDDTARPDDTYLQWMYSAGLKAGVNYDVLGAHGNTQCPSVEADFGACPEKADRMGHASFYFRRIEQLRQIQAANGDGDAQIWLLEFGWTSDTVNPQYSWFATTEEKKAGLIVQAFNYARQNWSPWIGVMTVWTLSDPNWGRNHEQVYWAVTNPDGTARPAYTRLMQARGSGELPTAGGGTVSASVVTPPAGNTASPPAAQTTTSPPPPPPPAASTGSSSSGLVNFRVSDPDGGGVNLRQSAGVSGLKLMTLFDGDAVTGNGVTQSADGFVWSSVKAADGTIGWVVVDYLKPAP